MILLPFSSTIFLPPKLPASIYFLALSQAPPALDIITAIAKPEVKPPTNIPITAGTPNINPTTTGTTIASTEGTIISFGDGKLKAECVEEKEEGIRCYHLIYDGILLEILDELGTMPLPPYIHEQLADQSRYNTVYAKNLGSAAAPTAGLHFTEELLKKIKEKKVNIAYVTLHVGLGTFRPVQVENIEEHKMHTEYYEMSKETADILNKTKKEGKKIIAVGTTSVRTLETIMNKYQQFQECYGTTDIFIYPGYTFQAIDCLITNFHLPKSTLIMLVSALAGRENVLNAYQEAIKEKYRFFSFGDSMLIK